MTSQHTDYLDLSTWLGRVRRLADGLRAGEPSSPERPIRQAYHLICLAPAPQSEALPSPMDETAFEALLANGEFETAITGLLGHEFAPSSSRDDRSLAALAAWADSVLNLETQPG